MIYTPEELKQIEERDRRHNYWRGFKSALYLVVVIAVVLANVYVFMNI